MREGSEGRGGARGEGVREEGREGRARGERKGGARSRTEGV